MAHGRDKSGDKKPKISFVAPIKPAVLTAVGATWGQALLTAILFVFIGVAFDELLVGDGIATSTVVALVVLVLLRAAIAAGVPLVAFDAAGKLEAWIRERVARHILSLGAPLRSSSRTGELVSTTTEATELAAVYTATFLGPIIASMTVPLVVLIVIAIAIDTTAAFWLFIAVPIIPLMVGGFQQTFQKVSDGFRDTANSLAARFLDALQGLPTLKLFNQGEAHGTELATQTEALRRAIMKLLAGNQVVLLVVDTMFSLGMIAAAAFLAMVRFSDGAITAGQALALVLLGLLLTEPLDKVGQFFYVGMSGMAAGKEVRTLLGEEPAVTEGAQEPPTTDGSFALRGVDFSYGDTQVLYGIDLDVTPGETVALVGPSGSGKTTIANLLQRNIHPDAGQLVVGGHDVTDTTSAWVRQQITVVAQSTYLFTGNLRDNLLVARPDATDDELWSALADANLADFIRSLPDQLETSVGERGLTLSGGQAQRVAIARAFLKDAPIIVLDEPTSSVDLESEAAILASLDRLTVGRTVVVVAHRLSTVRDADRIVVLEDGHITEIGSHEELVKTGGHYARAVARQDEAPVSLGSAPEVQA